MEKELIQRLESNIKTLKLLYRVSSIESAKELIIQEIMLNKSQIERLEESLKITA